MKLYTFSMLDLAVIQDGNRDIFGYYPEQINVFVRKNPFLFEGYSGVRKRIDLLERAGGCRHNKQAANTRTAGYVKICL
ncbi:hypothetical protein, partial [Kosmotoga sp.]|uniref:hypothetical protein n=1 Tax=Kosmotoga sp. TaxID=1955248 RepID=UPI00258A925B